MQNLLRLDFTNQTAEVICQDQQTGENVPVLVDLESIKILDAATNGEWHVVRTSPGNPTKYAVSWSNYRTAYMHRLLCPGLKDGLEVSHINGNGLDNRRSNLEALTPSEHRRRDALRTNKPRKTSQTGKRGVCPQNGRYRAYCGAKYLGVFDTVQDADACASAFRDNKRKLLKVA